MITKVSMVKGIGCWTAEMLLMACLGRPDVLPVTDLRLQRGFRRAFNLEALPTEEEMRQIARPWHPYRSVATWYMWRYLEVAQPGS